MSRLSEVPVTVAAGDPSASVPGRRWHPLWAILLLGAVVRVGLWFTFDGIPVTIVDAQDYHELAAGLAETGQYTDTSGNLTSLRPPLYPWLVSVVYRVFGTGNIQAVRAMDAGIGLATTVLVYLLGVAVYDRRVGVLAAALHCVYPSLTGFQYLLLSEVTFTFFVVAVTLLAVRQIRSPAWTNGLLLGLGLGLGALTRSILWLFAPLLVLYLFTAVRDTFGRRLLAAAVPLIVFALIVAPWSWRNTTLHGTFTTIDVMGGRNVMMGNYEHTPLERSWATVSTVTGDEAWHRVLAAVTPGYSGLTQGQIDKQAMKYGVRYFFTHPLLSLQRSTVKFFNFWQLERTLVAGAQQGMFGAVNRTKVLLLAVLCCGSYAAVAFAAIFGGILLPPQDRRAHLFLLCSIAFPCFIHSVAFAHSRYHLPVIPFLLLYASAAVIHSGAIWSRRRSAAFALAAGLCLLLAGGWLREIVLVDLHRFL